MSDSLSSQFPHSLHQHVVKSLVAGPVPAQFMQRSYKGSLRCMHSEEDHFGYGAINDAANQNAWTAHQSTDLNLTPMIICVHFGGRMMQ